MSDGPARPRSRLAHALAALYVLAISYASLQPFGDWIEPPAGTPFWLFAPWPTRWTRFDLVANLIAYLPLGAFVALMPRHARPALRVAIATSAGASLSFGMESLQMLIPPRDASIIDFLSNSAGASIGGMLSAAVTRGGQAQAALGNARQAIFLPGAMGDVGLALLAMWLVAQTNPAIPLFAVTFEPEIVRAEFALGGPDLAATLIEAASSAFQLVGIGLFVALLMRDRDLVGGAVLALSGVALIIKGVAAALLLRPDTWETWLRTGILLGIAAGALLLLFTIRLPRAPQVAVCAIALLSSLLIPLLAPDLLLARAPLSRFSWRYGHLLNFNGLTHAVLLLWPLAASAWLFVLAGRPAWGDPH